MGLGTTNQLTPLCIECVNASSFLKGLIAAWTNGFHSLCFNMKNTSILIRYHKPLLGMSQHYIHIQGVPPQPIFIPASSFCSACEYQSQLDKFIKVLEYRLKKMHEDGTDSFNPRAKESQDRINHTDYVFSLLKNGSKAYRGVLDERIRTAITHKVKTNIE